jgi:D-alanyl-D-alanine carboxypeptidase
MNRRLLIGCAAVVSASLGFSAAMAGSQGHSASQSHPAAAPVHRPQTSFPTRNVVFWAVKGGIFVTLSSVPLTATTNGTPEPTFAEGLLNILTKEGFDKCGYFVVDASTGEVIYQDDTTKRMSEVRSQTP